MSRVPAGLEQCPNELLLEIFQYFDARTLFQLFYSLNARFNALLTSFPHLSLVYHLRGSSDHQQCLFSRHVHTLLLGHGMQIDFSQFPNLRSLHLQRPLREVFSQVTSSLLPHLTHLSISYQGKAMN